MGEGDAMANALFGAVVTTVLSGIVPIAPLVGGAVAGYLQGGDRADGLQVGALSGVFAAVPTAFVVSVVFTVVVSVLGFGGVPVPSGLGAVFVAFLVVIVATVVVLSALGGVVGNYVDRETELVG